MTYRYTKGWYQVAFERDLVAELSPAFVAGRRLVLVKSVEGLRAFDSDCPHRGAHLAHGGRLCNDSIQCPFHGYRIRLGDYGGGGFHVKEYPLLSVGGMVFVRLSGDHENGWCRHAESLVYDHYLINGFEMPVRTRIETVIENAFDRLHFQAVHGVRTGGFEVRPGADGELIVESLFYLPTARAGEGGGAGAVMPAPYRAVVISPGLAMVELQGALPYTVITGATDTPDGGCVIRLSLALPRSRFAGGPPPSVYEPLLAHSRRGLEEDQVVWENLSPSTVPSWTVDDHPSVEFFRFCEAFRDG